MARAHRTAAGHTESPAAFRALGMLRTLRAFERRNLHLLRTLEDLDLVREIGYHQGTGHPLTHKELLLLGIGSVATVQRRLRRLRHLGAIRRTRCGEDRRAVEFTLSAQLLGIFEKYAELMKHAPA